MALPTRTAARLATVLATVVTASVAAAPATAADRSGDAAISLTGGTIATGASMKYFRLNVSNNGPSEVRNFAVVLDVGGLDPAKLRLDLANASGENGPVCDAPQGTRVVCHGIAGVIPPGIQYSWSIPVEKVAGARGDAGRIRATLTHDGADRRPADNITDLRFRVGGHGADLWDVADDAEGNFSVDDQGGVHWEGALAPGGIGSALFMVVNHGDTATTGMRVTIRLPKGVAFADAAGPHPIGCWSPENTCTVRHCDYLDANRVAVCDYSGFALLPFSQDPTEDKHLSKQPFYHAFRIDPSLPAPALLLTGSVSVTGVVGGRLSDVDPSDSVDGMRIVVS